MKDLLLYFLMLNFVVGKCLVKLFLFCNYFFGIAIIGIMLGKSLGGYCFVWRWDFLWGLFKIYG
jgi:hypothetical protein